MDEFYKPFMDIYKGYVFKIWTILILIILFHKPYRFCAAYKENTCLGSAFSPNCGPQSVIIMKKALYGRMREGVCGTVNLGYIGCSKDVLHILDIECSGRKSCSMRIDRFAGMNPCMQLQSYLEVDYICQKVIESGISNCQTCEGIRTTSPIGYSSSEITSQTNCGSSRCPWFIVAGMGQRIVLKLYDFSNKTLRTESNKCQLYASIEENNGRKSSKVCSSSSRESEVYTSSDNKIKLYLIFENRQPFLIEYTFIGCKDISNENMIFLRKENTAEIKCRNTNKKHNLECINEEWKGLSSIICSDKSNFDSRNFSNISWDLWAILISSICFMLGCIIIIFGLWCYCRDRNSYNNQMANKAVYDDIYNEPLPSRTLQRKYHEAYHHDRMKDYDKNFIDFPPDSINQKQKVIPQMYE